MACKLDVDLVIKQVIEKNVKNISSIKDGYASTTINFGKKDIEAIANLNKQWEEKVITYNSPIDNDIPGNITISVSQNLYDKYIKAIDAKRVKENTEQARRDLAEDAERAGVKYTDDYLFYQLNQDGVNPILKSSIEKSENPELQSVFLTPNTYVDKLKKYGFTEEEIEYLIQPLKQNKSLWIDTPNVYNLIALKVQEQLKFEKTNTVKKANKELDDLLIDFLKDLNITVNEYETLKTDLGINALGFANIIEKSVSLAKDRKIDTLPEEAAHFYVELLTKKSTKDNLKEYNLYRDLMSKIESWEKYKSIKKEYLPVYKDENKVKKEAIAKAISEAIINRFESKEDSLLKSIVEFLEWLKSIFKTNKNFSVELLADEIAKKMLSKDYSDIAKDLNTSSKLTNYDDIDKETTELINIFSKMGAYMTGSMSLRKQGTIYRTSDETFHDIDFKVPISEKDNFLEQVYKKFPNIEKRLDFENESSYITIWALNYNGKKYSIDFFFDKKEFLTNKDNLVNWKDTFKAKLEMGREKDVIDFINFIPFEKTEVEKILTEGDVQLRELVKTPEKTVSLDKTKKPEVIKKMKEILNILGVKTEIANLPEEIAAQADILNRLIQFANDSITEDNFTEETIHFIVEVLEQKNPELYNKLKSEIWKYKIYTEVKEEYSKLPEYQKENGRPDIDKIKKEAIGQLLTAKLLDISEIKDEKNFLGSVWEAISKFIKNLFYNIPYNQRDGFQKLADEIMTSPDLIKSSDVQFLGQGVFFSRKTKNRLQSSVEKVKRKFGTTSSTKFNKFESQEEAFLYFKDLDSKIQKVTEKEQNPVTGELEDVEYYVFEGNKKQRVTSVIKEANNKTYSNLNQDDQAKAIREAKKQKGTEVHKTIEDILKRFIDESTGLLRTTPLDRPLNLPLPKEYYNVLETHLINRLNSYPKGTRFLIEVKIVNEEQGYAGTIDFLAFLPNGQVDILDWKTTDVSYWENGQKIKRFDISPFNQIYWKTQLSFYKRALESHGIDNFRYTRAIPIALETKQSLIDKSKKYTPDNVIYQISSLKIGDVDVKKIKKDEFYLTPVAVSDEKTGNERLDSLIEKLQGIYKRIQATPYKKEEIYKKRDELNRISLAIRELQVKRSGLLFTTIFSENFQKYKQLAEKKFDFLDNIEGKKLLPKEQEDILHNYLNEVYNAIEFLQSFEGFPAIVANLFEEESLTEYEKEIKTNVLKLEGNAKTIKEEIIDKAIDVIDSLGKLYNIDQVSAYDNNNISNLSDFISILHRQEGSIQFAARLINAIKFLGEQESKKFFDENNGRFTQIFNAVKEWSSKNKKSIEQTYEFLLNKDKDGKPLRELLSKIKSEYYQEISNKQKEFSDFYEGLKNTISDLGYKGDRFKQELAKDYKSEILPWLKSNFNLTKYEEEYKKAFEKYQESIKTMRLDEDDLINEEKKKKRLQSWINEHDIYSSPLALSSSNYILYNALNEEKWYSEGYKKLLKPENKPLLDAYNLFSELNQRAENNGMLDDVFNAKRFIPNVTDHSLKRIAFLALKEARKDGWYVISKGAKFILKYLNFVTEIEATEDKYDPLTGKPLKRIPVRYKYVEEGKEQDLSNDLFYIYSLWADHIIKYEMLSNYENRFKMIQLLESIKEKSNAVDSKGRIIKRKDESGQPTLEIQLTPKNKSIEDDLQKIINNYIYSSNLDIKPEYYKLANLLYDYTALNFLGINITAWVANIVGASISAKLIEGKWFSKNDFEKIGVNSALGVFNKDLSKYGNNILQKSRYLIKNLNTRITSEYDKELASKFKASKLELGDIAFSGFRLGDHFIQDAIATSIFLNTTIIDGKFVNINDYVKAKYNSKIFDTKLSEKERANYRKQRDKEIQELKEKSNLYRFVEEKDGKFSFKGIDFNTVEGQAELLSYQNIIAHYIKQAIGNIDEWDKSINRMNWYWKFIMQFKNWMPRVFGSRSQDIEYQYELDDYHYGRGKIFMDSLRENLLLTTKELSKSLINILPFVNKDLKSVDIIQLSKTMYLKKKTEALQKGQSFNLTEDEFSDIYLTGLRKQFDDINTVITFMIAVGFMASLAGDDDDKWYWKILSRILFKIKRELLFTYDPNQQISFLSNGVIPALGSLAQLVLVLDSYWNEIWGSIGQKLPEIPLLNDPEKAEKKAKKAKPLSQTLKAIPLLRELHYWLSATSEDYADFMEIQQPRTKL